MISILMGNLIAYPKQLLRLYQLPCGTTTRNTLITDYGFIVPNSINAWCMLDTLEGYDHGTNRTHSSMCWFVDKEGVVRDLFMGSGIAGQKTVRRLPTGPGAFYVRSDDPEVERSAVAAYSLYKDNLPKIIEALSKVYPIPEDTFDIISIGDIQKLLRSKRKQYKKLALP